MLKHKAIVQVYISDFSNTSLVEILMRYLEIVFSHLGMIFIEGFAFREFNNDLYVESSIKIIPK